MRCARCGWPGNETRVLSAHRTSEGWVRYRRCMCGAVAIELVTLDGTADLRAAFARATSAQGSAAEERAAR